MGRKLDALLGRRNSSKNSNKLKPLLKLSISRLDVLKNKRQVQCSLARSDLTQLLNRNHHHQQLLLRVEQVMKEQNMLDVFIMIEGYCHLLIERLVLLETSKECPDELKEAISGLIYAASRCGEFPELQEIRWVFTSQYGKEFVARAVELRNGCTVNPKMIQKFSSRQPSLESRMKVLKEIASENGITLHLEEESSLNTNEISDLNQPKPNPSTNIDDVNLGDDVHNPPEEIDRDEQLSASMKARKYRNVASAAQAAFESAAYAAEAARAAVELSRYDSQDPSSGGSTPRQINRYDNDGSSRSKLGTRLGSTASGEVENSTGGLGFAVVNSSSESEDEEIPQNHHVIRPVESKERKNKAQLERSPSDSSSDSNGDTLNETKISSEVLDKIEPSEEIAFDKSDDETEKSNLPTNVSLKTRKTEKIMNSDEEVNMPRLNIERRPISVRARRGNRR